MKLWFIVFTILLPVIMIMNVHQSKKYSQVYAALRELQQKQHHLLDENQRVIAEIARNSAPTVVEKFAKTRVGELSKVDPKKIVRIVIPREIENP